jgi:hypothetical protein
MDPLHNPHDSDEIEEKTKAKAAASKPEGPV